MEQKEFEKILADWLESYTKKRNCYGEIERYWAQRHELDIIKLADTLKELRK